MSPKQFKEAIKKATHFKERILPAIVGTEAENHFKDSFHNEGFTDKTLEPWQDVKRRTDPRPGSSKSERTRKILTGKTADLGESIRWDGNYNQLVKIQTDVEYAQIHNEGGTVSGTYSVRAHTRTVKGKTQNVKAHTRNVNYTMPKRQFMGESAELDKKIADAIEEELDKIFNV